MKEIDDILAKHFSGEANPEENTLVAAWKIENEEEYALLAEAWSTLNDLPLDTKTVKTFDTKAAWEKVDANLVNDKAVKIIKMKFYRNVAAACAILLVGLAGYWFINNNSEFGTLENTANTPKEITLPDGSEVWLAANASLDYHTDFANNRTVKLTGEAFFEVARDESHPFVIKTEFGEVEVLGTAFNVNASANSTIVSVDHGKVALRNKTDEVQLTAGESATSTSNGLSEKISAPINFDAWKTGVFTFDNTPISEAVALLNAHYAKKIELDPKSTSDCEIHGTFENLPIEKIIETIVLYCDVKAQYDEDLIRLK